jgi:lipopolysaccharide export system permease protein
MNNLNARRRSFTLASYLIKAFIPSLLTALVFFVLLLEMADLFMNIVQYTQNEASFEDIARSMILYVPKCISWSLPIATLFAVSFTLGSMYANNELIVVMGSGIPLISFVFPLIFMAIIISAGFLFFEDKVVIPTIASKKNLTRSILKTGEPAGVADVTILGSGKKIIWSIRYFDAKNSAMNGILLVERSLDGGFISRLNAQSAVWTGTRWRFAGVRRFFWDNGDLSEASYGTWEDDAYAEPPESFMAGGKQISEMSIKVAGGHLKFLARSGLPMAAQSAEFYRRFAFSLTPLVVTLLSAAIVGKFKKNILLMSLLLSLIAATLYYVMQMITMLMAKNGSITPFAGAFIPLIGFVMIVIVLFKIRSA